MEDHIHIKLHEIDLTHSMMKMSKEDKKPVFSELENPPLAAQGDMGMLNDSRKQCLPTKQRLAYK